jgi:hypothetical protein
MILRLHRDHLGMRVGGTLTGLGFLLFGLFAVIGPDIAVSDDAKARAAWFGWHLIFAGATAIAVSWLAQDLSGIWCRRDRRLRWPWR